MSPSGLTKQARDEKRLEKWNGIKVAVFERARAGNAVPRCEYSIAGERCGHEATTVDHMFGGSGRRRAEEAVETCWALCKVHDDLRTKNKPTRLFWLGIFAEHALRYHYAGRVLELIDSGVALAEQKEKLSA